MIRKDSVADEIETLQANFKGDYDPNSRMGELELLPVICGESQPTNLADIVKVIQSLSHQKRELIRNVIFIIRIVLTNGATSATSEKSLSMVKRLKTWLRSTMTQKRFNVVSLLPENQKVVDEMSLIDVTNRFIYLHSARLNIFGKFTDKDL